MSPTYKYLINGIYWGYNVYNLFTNVLLTYWGIQVGGGYNKRQLVLWGDETMQIYGNFEGPLAMQRLGFVIYLGGGFKYSLFSPLPEEVIQFDEHIFFNGSKPPTRKDRKRLG